MDTVQQIAEQLTKELGIKATVEKTENFAVANTYVFTLDMGEAKLTSGALRISHEALGDRMQYPKIYRMVAERFGRWFQSMADKCYGTRRTERTT